MAPFYSSVPVRHDSVIVSQHEQYQDTYNAAAKRSSCINAIIYFSIRLLWTGDHYHVLHRNSEPVWLDKFKPGLRSVHVIPKALRHIHKTSSQYEEKAQSSTDHSHADSLHCSGFFAFSGLDFFVLVSMLHLLLNLESIVVCHTLNSLEFESFKMYPHFKKCSAGLALDFCKIAGLMMDSLKQREK